MPGLPKVPERTLRAAYDRALAEMADETVPAAAAPSPRATPGRSGSAALRTLVVRGDLAAADGLSDRFRRNRL